MSVQRSPFGNITLPRLAFGTMRLPTDASGAIDEDCLARMVAYAMEHGVNYFDTAYPYHGGLSEIAVGKALKAYPRESYCLATKYPGHQISSTYDPAAVFEHQLRKCDVDYFDFYLLHNVYEHSMDVYLDPQWGILDYFREQKRSGRIKHLGFSTHATTDALRRFLDIAGADMEFCQIQLNWMDVTLQDAKGKVDLLRERDIPIWVMEPVRGGRLCHLSEADEAALKARRPDESVAAWSFRYLDTIPGVVTVLSGMSSLEQMQDNVRTYETERPLSASEVALLLSIAEGMRDSVPCTACRYCTADCPMGLEIPDLITTYNELNFMATTNSAMRLEGLSADRQPSACIACGRCKKLCPQGIDIPAVLSALQTKFASVPKWRDICREREEAARRMQ